LAKPEEPPEATLISALLPLPEKMRYNGAILESRHPQSE
jgi:hypothetical protein